MHFVTIEKKKGVVYLVVKYRTKTGEKPVYYPLTAQGCRKAGADLHENGAEDWMHSSSTDFPHEYKPTFRGDVREYMSEGYNAAKDREEAPRKRLVDKMMAWCSTTQFQATLTPEEKLAFVKLDKRIKDNAKS